MEIGKLDFQPRQPDFRTSSQPLGEKNKNGYKDRNCEEEMIIQRIKIIDSLSPNTHAHNCIQSYPSNTRVRKLQPQKEKWLTVTWPEFP